MSSTTQKSKINPAENAHSENSIMQACEIGDFIVYACEIGDVAESWIISLHRTKRGAYFAGREWMIERFNESYESRAIIGKCSCDFMPMQSFHVIEMKIND